MIGAAPTIREDVLLVARVLYLTLASLAQNADIAKEPNRNSILSHAEEPKRVISREVRWGGCTLTTVCVPCVGTTFSCSIGER
jgi:hypothetical protein